MPLSTAAKALLVLGALVGGAAGVALAFGLRLDQLPPWMITVGMYKLAFIAAVGLFVAGALLGRVAQKRLSRRGSRPVVGPGPWESDDNSTREAERVERDRR